MKLTLRLLTPAFFLLAAPAAHAFDLFDAWQAALRYSADYAAAQYGRDAEQEQEAQTRAGLLPQIAASASYTRQPPSLSANTRSHGWNIQLSQPLYDKARWEQFQQGKLATQLAAQKLSGTEHEIRQQVAEAYFQVLLNRDKLASIEEEMRAYAQQIEQSQAMFEQGAATIVDTNEAQAGYEAARAKHASTQAALQFAKISLQTLTGLDADETETIKHTELDDLLAQSSLADWLLLAEQNNPHWQMQRLALESAQHGTQAARAQRLPKLTLTGGYQDNHDTQNSLWGEQHERSKGGTVSVQLTIPVFSAGLVSSQIREATARQLQNEAMLEGVARQIRMAVEQAYQSTRDGEEQIHAQQQALNASIVRLDATKLGQEFGVRSTLDVMQAQQAKADAEQKLAEARYHYILSYLSLLQHTGMLSAPEQQWQLQTKLFEPSASADLPHDSSEATPAPSLSD